MSFLPIGHTHADIDQTFSAISSHLFQNNSISMDDMLFELRQCYKKRVSTSKFLRAKMKGVYNLRDRVYKRRVGPFQWDLSYTFETCGDFTPTSATEGIILGQESSDENLKEAMTDDAEYLPEDFLSVRHSDTGVPFWIAKVGKFLKRNRLDRARNLLTRWYHVEEAKYDAFMATYTPAMEQGKMVDRLLSRTPSKWLQDCYGLKGSQTLESFMLRQGHVSGRF